MVQKTKYIQTEFNNSVDKVETETDIINYHIIEVKDIIGFVMFILLFIILIPTILYKYKYISILEVYLPNVDLMANILTWFGGPLGIWEQLYTSAIPTWDNMGNRILSFTTGLLINYMALLGVTFIVARESVRQKSVFKGWSIAFVMLIVTYLLPVPVINIAMDGTYDLLKNHTHFNMEINRIISGIIGIILTISVLFLEASLIHNYRKKIIKISELILSVPKLIMKYV